MLSNVKYFQGVIMAIPKTDKHFLHWNYFIALEEDLEKIARYIEFDEANYDTYSLELAHLLLASSSEVDVVLKALCNMLNPDKDHQNMYDYRTTIMAFIPKLSNEEVTIPRYGLTLNPLINWSNDKKPDWWDGYNNVKHHRDEKFNEANLKHTLNAVASLGLIVLYFYREELANEEDKGSTDIDFRDVTKNFHSETSLISFNGDYTHKRVMSS